MFIKSITVNNFRSFYGEKRIDLSTESKSPITMFIGENGAGKTTLLNTVFWAFTGDFTTGLKKGSTETPLIINKTSAQEGNKKCSVEIEFLNLNNRYLLKRSYISGDSDSDVSLNEYDSSGSLKPISNIHAKTVIEKFIPKKLASWFFFDGEAIDNLHLHGDSKFRDDVRQTFGFDTLVQLRVILEDVLRDYRKEESKLAKDEQLEILNQKIEGLEKEFEGYVTQIENLNRTIERSTQEISADEARLRKYPQAKDLEEKRNRAKEKLKTLENQKKLKEFQRNDYFINNVPNVILKDEFSSLLQEFGELTKKQVIPKPFGTQIIQDIKKRQKCICGTTVLPGSHEDNCLDESLKEAATSEWMEKIFNFRSQVNAYYSDSLTYEENMSNFEIDISRIDTDISQQELTISNSTEALGARPEKEIQEIENKIRENSTTLREATTQLGGAQLLRDQTKKTIDIETAKVDAILLQKNRGSNIRREKQNVQDVLDYLIKEFERQELEVLDALNAEISGAFAKILTKNFTAKVDPDTYKVIAYDINGKEVQLSTGETHVLKFSVIAAIVGLAANKTQISKVKWISDPIVAPLMFDAPFSVVDEEYGNGICRHLSELSDQLIMMFDSTIWKGFMSSSDFIKSKIGSFYLLIAKAQGPAKLTSKQVTIDGKIYTLNTYGDRDETLIEKVDLHG
jgi:DNA sulfur modification protein DndD